MSHRAHYDRKLVCGRPKFSSREDTKVSVVRILYVIANKIFAAKEITTLVPQFSVFHNYGVIWLTNLIILILAC